jgi:RNA polymerase sigma factor (sigma-70 family)
VTRALSQLVHQLGRVAARDGLGQLPDPELLRLFAADRDALAFEVLVWRHGAMVFDVCGRVLGRGADAEDAFQATFLALVRHARAVRCGESLAGWLYRVARRVSTRAGHQRVRQVRRERRAARPEAVLADDDAERADWRALLDREVERLPARYREAFILCHLEGRAHEDAARELGCALGTLHSRLARAKERLRVRLAACGVALPVVMPAAASARLVTQTVNAAVGLAQGSVVATASVAVALSQGVWRPMVLLKTKFVLAAVLAVTAAGSGVVILNQPSATATPTPAIRAPEDPALAELRRENERLRRELIDAKKKLAEAEAKLARLPVEDPPTDAEVLRAMPKAARGVPDVSEEFRDDITIVKSKILDRLDPPRVFPKIGTARLRTQHWECTVYYNETTETNGRQVKKPRVQVVYIDKDSLVIAPGAAK